MAPAIFYLIVIGRKIHKKKQGIKGVRSQEDHFCCSADDDDDIRHQLLNMYYINF